MTCSLLWYQLYFGKPVVNTLVWKGIDSFNKYSDVQEKKISRYEAPDALKYGDFTFVWVLALSVTAYMSG